MAKGVSAVEGYLDRIACVLGAVVMAQGPEFLQQYYQRLGGHLDEARRQLERFEAAASAAGKPFGQFVSDTIANPDAGLAKLGHTMQEASERVSSLQAAHEALGDASTWTRPFAYLRHADWEITQAALEVFKPAVPVTTEGAVYAAVGIAVGFCAWHFGVRSPVRLWHTRRQLRRQAARQL